MVENFHINFKGKVKFDNEIIKDHFEMKKDIIQQKRENFRFDCLPKCQLKMNFDGVEKWNPGVVGGGVII